MKKLISLLLAVAMLLSCFTTGVMAEEGIALIVAKGQDPEYNANQALLTLDISGIEADSYKYQWYNASASEGPFKPIYKETNETYVISDNDFETYIRCEVTPIVDGVEQKVITSDAYYQQAAYNWLKFAAIGRDQSTIQSYKDNPSTYFVNVAGENLIILDEYDDSFYVITAGFKGWRAFGDSATYLFAPETEGNIGHFLNNEFLGDGDADKRISKAIQEYIPTYKWWVGAGCDKAKTPYSFDAKISLLSAPEYGKYMDRIGWAPYSANGDWWLRNSRAFTAGPNLQKVIVTSNNSRYGQTDGDSTGNTSLLVRPTFYMEDDIFLNEKANVENMGAGVKEMFVERYSDDESFAKLEELYTTEELYKIGFDVEFAMATVTACAKDSVYNGVEYKTDYLTVTVEGADADSYKYQWYNATSAEGPFVPMYKQTKDVYAISDNDLATYIRCEVTPIKNGVEQTSIVSNVHHQKAEYNWLKLSAVGFDQTTANDRKNNPSTYFVNVAGENLLILDEYADSFYAITAGFKGWKNFGDASTYLFDPAAEGNIGHFLNNEFLVDDDTDNRLSFDIQKYLQTHKWWVGACCDKAKTPYSFEAKVSLLSNPEYGKYIDKIGWGPYGANADWWLRSSRAMTAGPNIQVVIVASNTSRLGQTNGDATGNKTLLVRPTFYLSDDIFLEKKANVENMGAGIKQMFVERYSNEEDLEKLKTLYTDEELYKIGFDVDYAMATIVEKVQDPEYNANQALLALGIAGIEADSYKYQWFNATSAEGPFVPMYKETNATYVISDNDFETYIRCEITPVVGGVEKDVIISNTHYQQAAYNWLKFKAIGRDQSTIEDYRDNPSTYFVHIGGENLIILDEYDDSFYTITAGFKGWKAFGDASTYQFSPETEGNIGHYLNNEFLQPSDDVNNSLSATIQQYIPTYKWWVGAGCDKAKTPYSFNAKVGLLSTSEYGKYMDRIGWAPYGANGDWWLRNSRAFTAGPNIQKVIVSSNTSRLGQTDGDSTGDKSLLVRPTFYMTDDIFLKEKANVENMGAGIKAMLVERYEKADLMHLYTEAELGKIGFEMVITVPEKYNNIYTKNEAVYNVSYVADNMDDIIITYTNGTVSDSVTEYLYPDDVFERTIAMSKLPYGENDVVITMTNSAGDIICETRQKMYILPEQADENVSSNGIAVHPAQFRANNKVFELVKKLGFTKVRIDFPWSYIETSKGIYDFSLFDALVAEAEKQGIELTAILCYNNTNYSDNGADKGGINTEEERNAFVNYVKTVAKRYPQLDSFEIWNEPNHSGFWSDIVNVDEYSALVEAASKALYEINSDYIIYAGAIDVSKDGDEFLQDMYDNELYSLFDRVSYHPYFRNSVSEFEEKTDTYKNIVFSNGGFKELVATEYGFNVADADSNPEATRAIETVKALIISNAKNTEENYVFNISEETYGLLNTSYLPNEIAFTFAFANSTLANARFLGTISTESGVAGYMYVKNNAPVSVYWATTSTNKTISVPSGAVAYDAKGNVISGSTITLTSAPVYVIGGNAGVQAAAQNEKTIRTYAIKTKFGLSTVTKDAIMNSSLSEKDKSAALYMLYEVNKVNAIYNSLTNTSNLTVPSVAVDCGGNKYAEAALKLAKKYIAKCNELASSTISDKNNMIAGYVAIANDLIESAQLLSGAAATTPSITNVSVTNGTLTFDVKNISKGTAWVAIYSGEAFVSVQRLSLDNLSCYVGTGHGKIFVWDELTPLTEDVEF